MFSLLIHDTVHDVQRRYRTKNKNKSKRVKADIIWVKLKKKKIWENNIYL